jgi:hypothetical protein
LYLFLPLGAGIILNDFYAFLHLWQLMENSSRFFLLQIYYRRKGIHLIAAVAKVKS